MWDSFNSSCKEFYRNSLKNLLKKVLQRFFCEFIFKNSMRKSFRDSCRFFLRNYAFGSVRNISLSSFEDSFLRYSSRDFLEVFPEIEQKCMEQFVKDSLKEILKKPLDDCLEESSFKKTPCYYFGDTKKVFLKFLWSNTWKQILGKYLKNS